MQRRLSQVHSHANATERACKGDFPKYTPMQALFTNHLGMPCPACRALLSTYTGHANCLNEASLGGSQVFAKTFKTDLTSIYLGAQTRASFADRYKVQGHRQFATTFGQRDIARKSEVCVKS